MKYRVLSSRVEIHRIGTFVKGDEIELDPKVAESISGKGGALLEPIEKPKPTKQKEPI